MSRRARASWRDDSRLRYGGPLFQAASALPVHSGLASRERLVGLAATALRHPARVCALALLLLLTKREHPRLSAAGAGRAISAELNDRFLGIFPRNRLCRGVLLLPESHDQYLRGRRRQALRTNLRKAAAANIRCEALPDSPEVRGALAEVLRHRGGDPLTTPRIAELVSSWLPLLARPETTLMLAWDASGRPCAFMAALIDEGVCLIRLAASRSHEARWALHDHLVATLIARRVKYLLADGHGPLGALGYDRDVQYYQRLLGYELRHLIPAAGSKRRTRITRGISRPDF